MRNNDYTPTVLMLRKPHGWGDAIAFSFLLCSWAAGHPYGGILGLTSRYSLETALLLEDSQSGNGG